jgi:ribosomal protein S18 acetylase RimI-like enzyme
MSTITIRKFQKSDQNAVVEIFQNGLISDSETPEIKELQRWFVNSKLDPISGDMYNIWNSFHLDTNEDETTSMFWVACSSDNDEIIGCIGCIPSTMYPNSIELIRMSVKYTYRHQGIATKLIATLQNWCIMKNKQSIHLDTLLEMEPAIQLYLKNGFTIVDKKTIDISERNIQLKEIHLVFLAKNLIEG